MKPSLEVKSRRVGGSNYQVPVEVNPNRRLRSASGGLSATRLRGDGKTMQEKLANEFLDAANLRGGAVKKREDTHRMAEAIRLSHTIDGKARLWLRRESESGYLVI